MKTKPVPGDRIVITYEHGVLRAGQVINEPSDIRESRGKLPWSDRPTFEELNKFVYLTDSVWDKPVKVEWADEKVLYEHEYADRALYGQLSSKAGKHARTLIALEIGLRGKAAPEQLPVKLALTLCRHYARLGHSAGPELVSEWKALWLKERSAFLKGEPCVWSMMYGANTEQQQPGQP
jgi:hypothetical protein